MEFHSPANRTTVRVAIHRQFRPSATSWMPLERRPEELNRRKEEVEKRIYRAVFWLAVCIFMIAVLISVSSFTVRLSPLTVLSIRLLIYGCCVLFVGQCGVVFVLNHQFELLSREITNVRYWREITQLVDRQRSLDGEGGNPPRNASQVHRNIQNTPNFRNLPSSQTFPNSQNVPNDSNFQNDVMNIFRIRNLLHYIPVIPKTKHWSMSPESANCGILMKQPTSRCCSYDRYLGEDRISCKNVLKRITNTTREKWEAFGKSASIWSNDNQPSLLDVPSSVELGKQRSDQLPNLICQLPTSLNLQQENLRETILDGEGEEISSPDNRQSTLTDNFCSEVGNQNLDQSVRSEHLARSTSLQSTEDNEYEHLLNITKHIWHPTCTAAYESTDPPSETERITANELESLGTSRLVEGMLKYVSTDFSLSSTVSESSNFLNINPDQHVLQKNLLVDKDNPKFISRTSDVSTSKQCTPSNFETFGKITYKRDIESFKKKDDSISRANEIAESQTSLGISQVYETNAVVEHDNFTENSDDILRVISHSPQMQFQKFDEEKFKLNHIVPTFDKKASGPIRVFDCNKVTKQYESTVSKSKDFLSINSYPHVLPVNSTMDNEVKILNSGASNASIDQSPTPSISTHRRKKKLKKRAKLFKNPPTDLNKSSNTSTELQTNAGRSQLTKTNSSTRLWMNPTDSEDDFSERKSLIIKLPSQKSVGSSQLIKNSARKLYMNPTDSADDISERKALIKIPSQKSVVSIKLTEMNSARKLCMNLTDSADEPKAQTASVADHSQIQFRNQSDDTAFDVEDHRASTEDSIRGECKMQSTGQISDPVSE